MVKRSRKGGGKIQRRYKTSKSGKGSGGETVKRDNYVTWRKRWKVEEGRKPVKKEKGQRKQGKHV